jgi:sarcosine oxidase
MAEHYDCIVLGVGGFGSGVLYHLAKRGVRTLGIEQFGIGHDRGSSHGETRIIRKAYFEHPDYVPLLHRAYDLWHELEQETRRKLLHPVGLFIAGAPDSESVSGTLLAAKTHQLPVDRLTPGEARAKFPGYRFPDGFAVVFERQAGYLEVEACVMAHVKQALRNRAVLKTDETVVGWSGNGRTVTLRTERGEYSAARLVITAGPWAGDMLNATARGTPKVAAGPPDRFAPILRVVRKPVFWFAAGPEYDVSAGNSTFFFETPAGQFYGFPRLNGRTIKLAEHTGGDDVPEPTNVDRAERPADLERVAEFLRDHLPQIVPQPVQQSVCMYTKTPDSHFLIDRHPEHANVVFGAGFSGHGFKFTSVLGEALAELALDGKTRHPVGFLALRPFERA